MVIETYKKRLYAVSHFFLNGGGTCWIVRIADNAAAASVSLQTLAAMYANTIAYLMIFTCK